MESLVFLTYVYYQKFIEEKPLRGLARPPFSKGKVKSLWNIGNICNILKVSAEFVTFSKAL